MNTKSGQPNISNTEGVRKEYITPKLFEYGNIVNLTQAGGIGTNDGFYSFAEV
jgi:hypothetical protein